MTSDGSQFWTSGAVPMIEPEYLSSIVESAADIALAVSMDGTILSVLVNDQETSLGKLDHWLGRSVRDFLTSESIPKFDAVLDRMQQDGKAPRPVELNHRDNAVWQFPIRYSFHRIGQDGAFLMLGRDLRIVAETQQQLVQAQMALERGYEARREFDARYRILLNSTREAFAFVSVADGRIVDINGPAATLLGADRDELANVSLAQEFQDRKRGEFAESLLNAALSDSSGSELILTTKRSRKQVIMTPTVFRAAGERLLFCRLETADAQQQGDDALTQSLSALYQSGTDAILFTDAKGNIEFANEALLEMVDAAHMADIRGRNLAEFLARGQIDLGVLLENAVRAGHMRIYATKLQSDLGTKTSVEIAAVYLGNRAKPGMGFVLRDAGRAEALRKPVAAPDDPARHNVMELVGSATLKEIVAETTDVVEKMCIETAVDLTRNNRVAAAEMLGLSRQSLYVKLRKYGLLNKDSDS